jgi:hypothetical protein
VFRSLASASSVIVKSLWGVTLPGKGMSLSMAAAAPMLQAIRPGVLVGCGGQTTLTVGTVDVGPHAWAPLARAGRRVAATSSSSKLVAVRPRD